MTISTHDDDINVAPETLRCATHSTIRTRTITASRNARADATRFFAAQYVLGATVLAVRWCLRFGLSYRDVEELLAERGIKVDHVTLFRWVQRFTPLLLADCCPSVPTRGR